MAHIIYKNLLRGIILVAFLVGCGDGTLILTFNKVPAQTQAIVLSVTLQNKGSLVQQPQEDVYLQGGFEERLRRGQRS